MRSVVERVALIGALFVATSSSGCILFAGSPWGQLVGAEVRAQFAPDNSFFDSEDRLLTAQDYAIQLDTLSATFTTLSLVQSTPEVAAAGHSHDEDVDTDEAQLEVPHLIVDLDGETDVPLSS